MKQSNSSLLSKKIRRGGKVILYELLPPPKNLSKADLQKSLSLFTQMLKKFPVDGVNLPEVREEVRNGTRSSSQLIKLEPIVVSEYLQRYGVKNIILNKPILHDLWEKQVQWLKNSYDTGLRNFVFVGGESSGISYPGISVIEAISKVVSMQKSFPDICIGGITIPTRSNEVERVMQKTIAGMEFFTSQILYEASSIKFMLKSYARACQQKNVLPRTIFLSFAPVTSYSDAELLYWLGVEIPQKTFRKLKIGWLGMAERSFQICENILSDILLFLQKENIRVPIGLNVEHINRHNFELSFILLERLSSLYYKLYKNCRF